jgi:two-component system cell cycle sensor histidine kinase PleC
LSGILRQRVDAVRDASFGAVGPVALFAVLCVMGLAVVDAFGARMVLDALERFGPPAVAVAALAALLVEVRRRRSLEVALQASEERARFANARLSDAMNSIDDGIQLWDKDERLVAYNRHGFMHSFENGEVPPPGITYREFLERIAWSGIMPEIAGREQAFVEAALQRHRGRRAVSIEHRLTRGRWVSVRWFPTSDGGAVAIVSDITERKRAEAALHDSEAKAQLAHARLLDAIESLPDGFVLWDNRGRMVLYNQASFGRIYSGAWKPPLGIAFPDYLAQLVERGEILAADGNEVDFLRRSAVAFSEGTPAPVEYRLSDGRWIMSHRRRTSDGGMVGILTDVTALKTAQLRAEAAAADVAEKRRQLDTAIEHIDQGLVFFDAEQRLILCNQRYRELFRLSAAVTQPGTPLREILEYSVAIGNYAPEAVDDVVQGRLALAGRSEHHRRWIPLADGRVIEATYEPLAGGGAIGTFRDVTERERATAAVIAAKNAAEAASQAKSRFLAQMSHELRTPLNAILGFSEIIRDRRFGDAAWARYAEYAADINRSGAHLLHVLNDVLYMAQNEGAGPRRLQDDALDLGEQMVQVRSMLAGIARDRGVEIAGEAPVLPALRADRTLVSQLLINLISNAIKFTPPGGAVAVTAGKSDADGLWITVADTGIGIAAEDRERVFEPFFQGLPPPGRAREGVGLGLPICKGIVELHGGTIAIDGAPGRGTCVAVRFPPARTISSHT